MSGGFSADGTKNKSLVGRQWQQTFFFKKNNNLLKNCRLKVNARNQEIQAVSLELLSWRSWNNCCLETSPNFRIFG
jgi:hypothetical protein